MNNVQCNYYSTPRLKCDDYKCSLLFEDGMGQYIVRICNIHFSTYKNNLNQFVGSMASIIILSETELKLLQVKYG